MYKSSRKGMVLLKWGLLIMNDIAIYSKFDKKLCVRRLVFSHIQVKL
jgi:hypothetical protein